MTPPLCALCLARPAELYCKNDDANLCGACDASYHSSNPLAARHERVPLPACAALECSSNSAALAPQPSFSARTDSDADLAVVPEYCGGATADAAVGGAMGGHGTGSLAFDDGLLGGAPAFSSGDLLDFTSGTGLLDFDLNDLLVDFAMPGGGPEAEGTLLAAPAPAAPAQLAAVADAGAAAMLVPTLPKAEPEQHLTGSMLTKAGSLLSSQTPFGLAQAPSQDLLLHMVPQMPTSFSQLIPVPSASVMPTKAEPPQQQQEAAAAAKHASAAAAVPEQPLTRAERVARYLEKKKRRNFKKVIRYQSRKAYAEVRPRIKGRFATPAEVAALKAAEAAKLAAQQAVVDDDVAVVPVC